MDGPFDRKNRPGQSAMVMKVMVIVASIGLGAATEILDYFAPVTG